MHYKDSLRSAAHDPPTRSMTSYYLHRVNRSDIRRPVKIVYSPNPNATGKLRFTVRSGQRYEGNGLVLTDLFSM